MKIKPLPGFAISYVLDRDAVLVRHLETGLEIEVEAFWFEDFPANGNISLAFWTNVKKAVINYYECYVKPYRSERLPEREEAQASVVGEISTEIAGLLTAAEESTSSHNDSVL